MLCHCIRVFFFNDTATTEIYTLSLHDALPILESAVTVKVVALLSRPAVFCAVTSPLCVAALDRSEEHTSELQSQFHLVCRLLLEKKKMCSTSMLRHCIRVLRRSPLRSATSSDS